MEYKIILVTIPLSICGTLKSGGRLKSEFSAQAASVIVAVSRVRGGQSQCLCLQTQAEAVWKE